MDGSAFLCAQARAGRGSVRGAAEVLFWKYLQLARSDDAECTHPGPLLYSPPFPFSNCLMRLVVTSRPHAQHFRPICNYMLHSDLSKHMHFKKPSEPNDWLRNPWPPGSLLLWYPFSTDLALNIHRQQNFTVLLKLNSALAVFFLSLRPAQISLMLKKV